MITISKATQKQTIAAIKSRDFSGIKETATKAGAEVFFAVASGASPGMQI